MGWGYGELWDGKKVGYSVRSACEHKGCKAKIDRGLAYACGGMHGADEISCDGYFCEKHLFLIRRWDTYELVTICSECCDRNDKAAAEEAKELGLSLGDYWEKVEAEARKISASEAG